MREPVIVGSVLYGADQAVMEWVINKVPIMMGRTPHNAFCALGVVRRGNLVGGVVFSNYRPGIDIEISIAATTPAWLFPDTLVRLYDYPFQQLGLPRMSAIISRKNKRCRELAEGVGWKLEGVSRRNYDGRNDACIYGLFKHELRIKGRGQIYTSGNVIPVSPVSNMQEGAAA